MKRRLPAAPSHLYRKSQTYYFRIALPMALRVATGRTELRVSLLTTELRVARLLAAQLNHIFVANVAKVRAMAISYDELKRKMNAYLRGLLHDYDIAEGQGFSEDDDGVYEYRHDIDAAISTTKLALQNGAYIQDAKIVAYGLLRRGYFTREQLDEEMIPVISKEVGKCLLKFFNILKSRQCGNFDYEEQFMAHEHDKSPIETEQDNEDLQDFESSPKNSKNKHSHIVEIGGKPFDCRLENCINYCLSQKVTDNKIQQHMPASHKSKLVPLVRFFNNADFRDITRNDIREYRDTLSKLPPYYANNKAYSGMSMQSIAALKHEKTLSTNSVAQHMDAASTLFKYITKETNIEATDISGLAIHSDEIPALAKDSFCTDELKQIFSIDTFANSDFTNPAYFWIPLLCLFTGARLEEMSQLYIADIKTDTRSRVKYFDITTIDNDSSDKVAKQNPDKHLKNRSARRTIPLHKVLIDIGFIEYVDFIKSCGYDRVFPMLNKVKDNKYGKQPSKQFSKIVDSLHIKGNKSMNSLRHTFNNYYKQNLIYKNEIERDIYRYFFGHRVPALDFTVYGDTPWPQVLYDVVISRLDYGVDFSPLAGSKYIRFLGTNTRGRRKKEPAAHEKTKKR